MDGMVATATPTSLKIATIRAMDLRRNKIIQIMIEATQVAMIAINITHSLEFLISDTKERDTPVQYRRSRTKSLNLAGIFIVRFGLLCGSVVSEVVTDKANTKRMANLQSLRLQVGYIPLDLDNAPCLTKDSCDCSWLLISIGYGFQLLFNCYFFLRLQCHNDSQSQSKVLNHLSVLNWLCRQQLWQLQAGTSLHLSLKRNLR
ncbi:hypothetical protein P5673_004688 [Acropora cervicornis]|uniref:Uncharacterized protein n=1 Tax=Acropora cervicornis TaxID=6130 RepID=A0AAD9VDW6_ACRCE|nr:hypothetical protein P5673_004688 [Acropora cervicornis]